MITHSNFTNCAKTAAVYFHFTLTFYSLVLINTLKLWR